MHTQYSSSELLCRLSTHTAGLREQERKLLCWPVYAMAIIVFIYIYAISIMHNHCYMYIPSSSPNQKIEDTQKITSIDMWRPTHDTRIYCFQE